MFTQFRFAGSLFLSLFLLALAVVPTSPALAEATGSGSIYDKPYLMEDGPGIAVGGYIDMEFEWPEGGDSTFDQHRLIPFFTARVSDRVMVSTEIEFEHGGDVPGDGEVKIEYGVLDFAFSDGLNFRGGVILSPLGSFNLLHDSPLNDLTARPVVTRQLIPSTLSESGMGLFGTFPAGEEGELDYQIYLVNGFDEGMITGDPGSESLRIRSGRGSKKADNNGDKAITGRLGYSPMLGVNLGGSFHTGAYDDEGDHRLNIFAVDAKTSFGALEVQGEWAMASADVDRDLYPTLAEKQSGAYLQANWHILHDKLMDGSVVTLVGRGDWMDYDSDVDGDSEEGWTLGANFRPTEETAFKLDYNWARTTPAEGEAGDYEGRLFFSFASYF